MVQSASLHQPSPPLIHIDIGCRCDSLLVTSYGHSTPSGTMLLLHITSPITHKCHPFHCSIPTSDHDETTKHDRRALNNMEGSLCAMELLRRSDFTDYTTIGELSLGITIAQHMAIYRTTPMVMSFKSTLPSDNNDTTTIVFD